MAMVDLPWPQEELPYVEQGPAFTDVDLAGPHTLVACGFKTKRAGEEHIRRNDLAPKRPDGWTGLPIPVQMVEWRVMRGFCVVEYPRYQLRECPF